MLNQRNRGFSLVELLVALAAMALVITFALGTFTHQHQTYVVVDQVSETQQNTRALASLIERDLRNAGYMVAPEAAACGTDSTTAPDSLFVSDTDAILPIDQLPALMSGLDLGGEVSSAVGSVNPATQITFTVDDVVIDGNPTYDVNNDGTPDSDFQVGGGAILIDSANVSRGVACGVVDSVTAPNSVQVTFHAGLAAGAANPSAFVLVPAHVYQIVAGPPSELQRDGKILAKDVEDMQLAWYYDDSGDNLVNGTEMRGVVGNALDTTLVDGKDLREVRVNLVAATRSDDPRKPTSAGTGQVRENRTAGSVAADDGKRRRVSSSTIRVRNLTL